MPTPRTSGLQRRDDEPDTAARLFLLFVGLTALANAALAAALPALAWPWPLAPLHARCVSALQAGAALAALLAVRERDGAALRIPLAQALAGSACSLLLTAWQRPALGAGGWAWLVLHAVTAAGAAWHLAQQAELQAPAERPDRALRACAAGAGAAATLLAFAPALAARLWPWPLGPAPALLYAGQLVGWAVALAMLARERRRGVRGLVLQGLLPLGPAVALASAWHLGAFRHPALAGAWAFAFVALSLLAARRLRR